MSNLNGVDQTEVLKHLRRNERERRPRTVGLRLDPPLLATTAQVLIDEQSEIAEK